MGGSSNCTLCSVGVQPLIVSQCILAVCVTKNIILTFRQLNSYTFISEGLIEMYMSYTGLTTLHFLLAFCVAMLPISMYGSSDT